MVSLITEEPETIVAFNPLAPPSTTYITDVPAFSNTTLNLTVALPLLCWEAMADTLRIFTAGFPEYENCPLGGGELLADVVEVVSLVVDAEGFVVVDVVVLARVMVSELV
jgi:hypothetical protein